MLRTKENEAPPGGEGTQYGIIHIYFLDIENRLYANSFQNISMLLVLWNISQIPLSWYPYWSFEFINRRIRLNIFGCIALIQYFLIL